MTQPDFEQLKKGEEMVDIHPDPIPIIPLEIIQEIFSNQSGGSVLSGNFLSSPNFEEGSKGWKLTSAGDLEANSGTFRGQLIAGYLDIPDQATANSFHVETDGDTFWGCTNADFTSDNENAIAYILKTGVAKFQNVILKTSVQISNIIAGSEISIQGWVHTLTFSVTDADTVAWGSGTITLMDGTAYSIDAGNTGNMAAETYIYLDVGTSETVLQTTTTKSNAVGSGKILICVAQNGTGEASFVDFGSKNVNIPGTSIVAASITGDEIAANTITANKISVSNIAAISADLGMITAGNITLDTAGYIKGGQTAYNTGTGFFLGYDTSAYKFSIGDSTQFLKWDGSNIKMTGGITSTREYETGEDLSDNEAVFLSNGTEVFDILEVASGYGARGDFGQASSNNNKIAQTFTMVSTPRAINSIDVDLRKQGSPTDNVKVSIYATSGGTPTGSALAYGTKSGSSLTTSFVTYTITLDTPIDLTNGTVYAVVFERDGSLNNSNYYQSGLDTGNPYASGTALYDQGGGWSTWSGYDLYIHIKVTCIAGKVYLASAATASASDRFIGFANGSFSIGDSASICVGEIDDDRSGLSTGSIYYLSDTPGSISTSAGTVTKKVGLAFSATELKLNYTI